MRRNIALLLSSVGLLGFAGVALATAPSTSIGIGISTNGSLTVSGTTTLGVIVAGTWNGSAIGPTSGGTGLTSYATGDLLFASAANTLSKLAAGADGKVLELSGGLPSWQSLTKSDVGLGNVVNLDTSTTANITDSSNKRFVTDAQLTVIGNTSGTNSGDQDLSGLLVKSSNLSDLTSASSARTNLGLVIGTDVLAPNGNGSSLSGLTKTQVGLGNVVNLDTSTTANITDSSNKRFVTDAQLTVIGNTSGTNTGDQSLTGLIAKSIGTAKGDLVVFTGSATPVRLGVGSDNQVLTADSTQTSGVKWATSASGFSDPMSARGDLIFRDATNTTARLPIGSSGKVLRSDGTDASWTALTNSDVNLGNVENTQLSTWAGSSNLTTLGIITSGTWNGTAVDIAHGGTGATSANAGFNALAPSQGGNSGKYLTTNGTSTSWATVSAGSSKAILSGGGKVNHAQTRFISSSASSANAGDTLVSMPMPYDCTAKNFYVAAEVAPGTGGSGAATVTLDQNEGATTVTCVVATGGTTCNDTTHTVAFTAGQRWSFKVVNAGTNAAGDGDYKIAFECDSP